MAEDAQKGTQVRGIQAKNSDNADSDSGEAARQGSDVSGSESLRVNRADSKGISGEYRRILGKILRQLRSLQEAHLAYVNAHGERLEARLQENRVHKNQVMEEMKELEQEVIKLFETGDSD